MTFSQFDITFVQAFALLQVNRLHSQSQSLARPLVYTRHELNQYAHGSLRSMQKVTKLLVHRVACNHLSSCGWSQRVPSVE